MSNFDPSKLPKPEYAHFDEVVQELSWFSEELKNELKLAVKDKNKARAVELQKKIDEVDSKIRELTNLQLETTVQPITPATTTSKPKAKRELPAKAKSLQFDLFRQFTTNYESDVSNSLELWDAIPKYFLTAAQVKSLRTDTGLAMPAQWEYSDREGDSEVSFSVRIQPALLDTSGKTQAYFPGPTEEIIEEVLKKFLLDQQLGLHDAAREETWVKFSLSMIERELASRGKTRNKTEIRHSLEVMSRSHLTWIRQGKAAYQGSIISELITVDRTDYEADGTALWAARLPTLVSASINKLRYRQFNYLRLMDLSDSLSRWIYKRLINRYKQASRDDAYTIHFKTIKQLSALLQQKDDRGNRGKVLAALNELKSAGVLSDFDIEEIKVGRQVTDAKYVLIPSDKFVAEQKAANKRQTDASLRAQQEGIQLR